MHTRNEVKESRKRSVGSKGTWKHGRIKEGRKEKKEGRKIGRKERKWKEGNKERRKDGQFSNRD